MRNTIFSFSGILFCCLLLLLTAMTCEGDEDALPPVLVDVVGVQLVLLDNSGHVPKPITDDRCPKEAYMMKVVPDVKPISEETFGDAWSYRLNRPITAIRIVTLTDFNEEYPAGSDIYPLFYRSYSPAPIDFPIDYLHDFEFVLLTYPKAGTYRFRVELEVGKGEDEETGTQDGLQVFIAETPSLDFY